MTNIIDHTYFINRLQIANLQSVTDTDVLDNLTSLISQYQYEFLNDIMGPAIYVEFAAWYAVDPLDEDNPFFELLNGSVFEDTNGKTWNWVGLKNAQLLSPLANYCYYTFQDLNFTQTTSAGESRAKTDNSAMAYPDQKLIDVWSQMVDWLRSYFAFMDFTYGSNSTGNWAKYRCIFLKGNYNHKVNFLDA